MSDEQFTKIASALLTGVRDLVGWGIDGGHTTTDKLRLTVEARRETALKLIEGGMSQRQAAKTLGVGLGTVQRDLTRNGSGDDPKRVNTKVARGQKRLERMAPSGQTCGAYWKWAAIDAMYSGWRIVDERLKRDQERKRAGEK